MFTLLVAQTAGLSAQRNTDAMIDPFQSALLKIIVGAGFLGVSLISLLLRLHAWRLRNELTLNQFANNHGCGRSGDLCGFHFHRLRLSWRTAVGMC
jgi:hypothetical protein